MYYLITNKETEAKRMDPEGPTHCHLASYPALNPEANGNVKI